MIYDNIRAICEKKGFSIKQVERDLGFSNSSICKWNECEPGIWKVQKRFIESQKPEQPNN